MTLRLDDLHPTTVASMVSSGIDLPKRRKPSARSESAELLAFQIRAHRLEVPQREFVFHPSRKWRFDFAWHRARVAVEVEGLVVTRVNGKLQVSGRHASIAGMREDMEKYNEAALLGWRVLRFEQSTIKSGEAIATIHRAMAAFARGD